MTDEIEIPSDKSLEFIKRYEVAAHRMQSTVAFEMSKKILDAEDVDLNEVKLRDTVYRIAKDLRVGVNSALVDSSLLVPLLIRKGILTREEYLEELAIGMEREADERVAEVCEKYGLPDGTDFA